MKLSPGIVDLLPDKTEERCSSKAYPDSSKTEIQLKELMEVFHHVTK